MGGFVIACDRDAESLELARANTARVGQRMRFFHGPFSKLPDALAANGIERWMVCWQTWGLAATS